MRGAEPADAELKTIPTVFLKTVFLKTVFLKTVFLKTVLLKIERIELTTHETRGYVACRSRSSARRRVSGGTITEHHPRTGPCPTALTVLYAPFVASVMARPRASISSAQRSTSAPPAYTAHPL